MDGIHRGWTFQRNSKISKTGSIEGGREGVEGVEGRGRALISGRIAEMRETGNDDEVCGKRRPRNSASIAAIVRHHCLSARASLIRVAIRVSRHYL